MKRIQHLGIGLVTVAAVMILAACAAGPSPGQERSRTREGRELLQAERYTEAVETLEEAARTEGDAWAVWYYLGLARTGAGQPEQAVEAYGRAIQVDPALPDAWANLGYLQLELDHLSEAARAFQELDRLEPDSAEPVGMLAQIELTLGDRDAALGYLKQALERDPTREKLRLQAATLLVDCDKIDQGRALLDAAPAPRSPELLRELLRTCLLQRDGDCLVRTWPLLLEQGEPDPILGTAAADLLRRQGEPEQARTLLEPLLIGAAPHGPALRLAGLLEHQAGRAAPAEELYRRCLTVTPDDQGARYDLGRLLAASGRTEEALAMFDAVLMADPDDLDACGQKAMALAEAGRLVEALPYLRRFVRDAPAEYAPFVEQMKAWIQKAETASR